MKKKGTVLFLLLSIDILTRENKSLAKILKLNCSYLCLFFALKTLVISFTRIRNCLLTRSKLFRNTAWIQKYRFLSLLVPFKKICQVAISLLVSLQLHVFADYNFLVLGHRYISLLQFSQINFLSEIHPIPPYFTYHVG